MSGTSGIEALSERSEITEKVSTSTSDGVDGGLGLRDEEVGNDTSINGLGPGGTAVAAMRDMS
jgi:hypothetical protein